MTRLRPALLALPLLAGCTSGQISAPAQPTPASIQAANVQLSVITSDPMTTWRVGDYSVRSACYGYLNGMAARSADLNLASGALGLSGPAAAGFLVSGGNPGGAAAAGVLASLGQTFLSLFNSSGAIPYTVETSTIIWQAMNAYETGVDMSPPTSVAQAISYVDDLWWQCSPGGYAMLASKAIGSANIGLSPNIGFSARARSLGYSSRPVIVVNP